MTTRDLVLIIALSTLGSIGVAGVLIVDVLPRLRDRRARARALADVEARVAELDALPAPVELPQARQPTKAELRAQRGRQHPIARKRRDGRWG
jgi:hypothetical protein